MGRLKKEDYIARYGEDAWLEESKKRYFKYYEQRKAYKEKNRDKIREDSKRYWREKRKQYIAEHIDEYREKWKKRKKRVYNKEKKRQANAAYQQSENGRAISRLHSYKRRDLSSNRGECTLTKKWILENIFNSSCVYCGDSNWEHLGCDRIDNNLPHTPENVVCSCSMCNKEREYLHMTVEEFMEYRKTHPRILNIKNIQEIVEINGIKVIRKTQV